MAYLGKKHTVDPNATASFEVIPEGRYIVKIKSSEMKETKSGSGQYLQLNMSVADGEFKGAPLVDRLNLINDNEKAVEIAERTLNQLCTAAGKDSISDSEELHNIPVLAIVKIEPAKGEYGESNRIRGYLPYEAPVERPIDVPAGPADLKPVAAKTSGAAPWKKPAPAVEVEEEDAPFDLAR